jgi:CHAT domain-containing protein
MNSPDNSESEMFQIMAALPEHLRTSIIEIVQQVNTPEELEQLMFEHSELKQSLMKMGITGGPELNQILKVLSQPPKSIEEAGQRANLCRQALMLIDRRDNEQLWALLQDELGNNLQKNPLGDRAKNIEDAINAYEQSLQVRTRKDFPKDWAMTQNDLANAYLSRIRGDRAENIEEAINAYERALQVRTRKDFPEDWAMTQNNLAVAYSERIRGDRAENIEEAINAYERALQVRTRKDFPEDWAMTQNNLAVAYKNRIRGDRAENIEEAINACEQALQVRTRKDFPEDWAATQNNLANTCLSRIRGDRAENIEEAINAYEQVLQVVTRKDFPEKWAANQNNLANAYLSRIRGDRAENIEEAINAYEQALQVRTRKDFPEDWAMAQNNLANAYLSRIRGDRAENIEEAINAYERALQVYNRDDFPEKWATAQNNLAKAYVMRIRGDRAENIEEAINAYERALQVYTRNDFPKECRKTARLLANLLADESRWSIASSIYTIALAAAENCYAEALSIASQISELSETNDLYSRAAYTYAQGQDPQSLETAVATLEQGRARGLREILERDRTDLSRIATTHQALYNRYQTAAATLRILETTERSTNLESPTFAANNHQEQATQTRGDLKAAIDEIRQISGYENFLTLPTFTDVATNVQTSQPLVYIVTNPNGSLGFILHRSTKKNVQVNSVQLTLTESELRALLVTPTDSETVGGWFGAYDNRRNDQDHWFQTIENVTQALWETVMAPIIQALQNLNASKAVLIPSGLLSFLPLHAAWTSDDSRPTGRRYALDDIQFTYSPNALSLNTTRQIATVTPATSLLAIDNPTEDLPNSQPEVENAIATFPKHQVLRHEQATREAVLAAIPNHSALHFSCHGFADFRTPLNGGLLLANHGNLTLKDFFNTQLNGIRLAILSACETGLPGAELPDEALSLPTGLLQAGVAGVAASLWAVDDLSTMMLLSRFYDLWRPQGPGIEPLDPPEALRQAQIWVRDTTNDEKVAYFSNFMPEFNSQTPTDKMAAETANYLHKALIFSRPQEQDFEAPFHWAAFTYVGV